MLDSKDSGTVSSEEGDHKMQRLNESRPGSTSPDICNRPSGTSYPLYHPANLYHYRPQIDMKHTPGGSTNHSLNSKPRIWSLADMASKEEKQPSDAKQTQSTATLPGLYPSSTGKIVSPLPSRMHYPPFFKPRDAVVSFTIEILTLCFSHALFFVFDIKFVHETKYTKLFIRR